MIYDIEINIFINNLIYKNQKNQINHGFFDQKNKKKRNKKQSNPVYR